MGWQAYYTFLKAQTGPIIACLKDVDQSFPGRSAVFGEGLRSRLWRAEALR